MTEVSSQSSWKIAIYYLAKFNLIPRTSVDVETIDKWRRDYSQQTIKEFNYIREYNQKHRDDYEVFENKAAMFDGAISEARIDFVDERDGIAHLYLRRYLGFYGDEAARVDAKLQQVYHIDAVLCPLPNINAKMNKESTNSILAVADTTDRFAVWAGPCISQGKCRGLLTEVKAMDAGIEKINHKSRG